MIEYPTDGGIVFHRFHISTHRIIRNDEQLGETVDIVTRSIRLYWSFAVVFRIVSRFLCHHAHLMGLTIVDFRGSLNQRKNF